MPLTAAQNATLKADIAADATLSQLGNDPDNDTAIANAYNLTAAPAFFVWQTAVPVGAIYNAISWPNLTPSDNPDGTQAWNNRALACQGKQFNLQLLLQGAQATINAARANVRAGLQDALTNVPSGASGALQNAGFPAVSTAMQRQATRAEKLLATGAGTAASPATLGFEGALTYSDVQAARSS